MTDVKPRRKGKPGIPNKIPLGLAEALTGTKWGPAMAALANDKQRAFVLCLYEVPRGNGAAPAAARMAGFGTSTSSDCSMRVNAFRLMHNPRILAAIAEEDIRRIKTSAPRAIRALQNLIEDPTHKGHERALQMVMDRVHPAEQRHVHEVHHHIDHDKEAIEHLRMLKSLDVPRAKLEEVFGFSGLSRYERMLAAADGKPDPKLIEGKVIKSDDAA
jgi:phage terminase small subunit